MTAAPIAAWPVGRKIILVDAWMRNPIEVKVTGHPNAENLIAEDSRGVVYYAHHGRVKGFAARTVIEEYEDLF